MNNHIYVQINELTDITFGKSADGSVFVSIGQKDRLYPIIDINNSGENNSRELGVYLHFRDIKDIDNLQQALNNIRQKLYIEMLNNQNDEYNYGQNVENKVTYDMDDIDL
jgi:hypothetical protein